MPTPTINNRTTYNKVLAIGFNRVFRDERRPLFGFSIRTVFTITAPGRKGGILPLTLGIGFTAVGMTNPDFTLRVAPGIGGGLSGFFGRVSAASRPFAGCCWLLALTFFFTTF
jgi:hypothetical protein